MGDRPSAGTARATNRKGPTSSCWLGQKFQEAIEDVPAYDVLPLRFGYPQKDTEFLDSFRLGGASA